MNRIAPVAVAVGVIVAVAAGLLITRTNPLPPAERPPAVAETADAGAAAVETPADAAPRATPAAEPAPAAPDPANAAERQRWSERLDAADAVLVEQAIAAGCDAERAEVMRQILADQRAARAKTTAAFEAGAIDGEELARQAVAAQQTRDQALAELLQPDELAALDPGAARAEITAREHGTQDE